MRYNQLLIDELDDESRKTRAMLERVPPDKKDFAPHPKSTPLGRLAPHVAQLGGFGVVILTQPALDFAAGSFTPLPFESPAQLVRVFDEGIARVREALANVPEASWSEPWKLSIGPRTLFEGSRFLAYREMYLNHIVHHRAQLGVYLRLNDTPVPSTYGPSADDTLGL